MRHLLCHLWLAAARWPPENPCEGLGPEECTARSTCEMDCRSSGLTYRPHTCWPVRGDGWGCDYYGGRYFCSGGPWSCKSGFGKISGNGCHCWSGYRGYAKCCPCPAVENCAREHVTCSTARKAAGGSLLHLQPSRCALCNSGYILSDNDTACVPG
ncbi:unnamed protein product [Effrenium voratum]|nr:unnamed protein product [Effrenium voratum]